MSSFSLSVGIKGVIFGNIWSPENIIFVLSSNKEISVRSCPGVKIVVKFLFTSFISPSSRRMSGFEIFPAYDGVFIEAISFKKLVGALCFSA